MNIELGGGLHPTNGYINFDIIDKPMVNIRCDLRIGIPCKNSIVDKIITIEFLEHLTRQEGLEILKECYRVLKPKGELIISCPDLEGTIIQWLISKNRLDRLTYLYGNIYGQQTNEWDSHKAGWRTMDLIEAMKNVGFSFIEDVRKEFLNSLKHDPQFPGGRPFTAEEFSAIKIYVRGIK